MAHREGIRAFLKDVDLQGLIVHDWGCGTKHITDYHTGTPAQYIGIDKREDVEADMVVDFSRKAVDIAEKADIAFCLEVLEHVPYPQAALANIFSNLKPGGPLYLSVPFFYENHSEEDYWRFTQQGITFLLESTGFIVDEVVATAESNWGSLYMQGWVLKAHRK